MKTRTRRSDPGSEPPKAARREPNDVSNYPSHVTERNGYKLTVIDIEQPEMFVVQTTDEAAVLRTSARVKGAYVKVTPTVRVSERSTLDTKAIRNELVKAGAIAVVVAPVIVPDISSAKPVRNQTVSASRYVEDWFETLRGNYSKRVQSKALEEALASVHGAGL